MELNFMCDYWKSNSYTPNRKTSDLDNKTMEQAIRVMHVLSNKLYPSTTINDQTGSKNSTVPYLPLINILWLS